VLDNLRVASPCGVSWDEMLGNGRVRHCAKCDKPVFNISSMTRSDAQEFLLEQGKGACLHFYRRADGTLITADCPIGQRIRDRSTAMFGFLLTAVAGLFGLMGMARPAFLRIGASHADDDRLPRVEPMQATTGGDWECPRPHDPR
jgi:hypothetical protein